MKTLRTPRRRGRRDAHPVLFNFPAFLAHSSTRRNIHRPTGIRTEPINARITSSETTADRGAPTKYSAVEAGFPTPNSFRHADNVYVAGEIAERGCIHFGSTSIG